MRGGCIALRCSGLGVSCPDTGGALGAALRFELSLCRDWQKGSHELEQRVLYANVRGTRAFGDQEQEYQQQKGKLGSV